MHFSDSAVSLGSHMETQQSYFHSGSRVEDQSDVFASRSPSPSHDARENRELIKEPSDIPRLRNLHNTAGYREGVSAAKSNFMQEGFDEGFSLGAVVGKRVGLILGLLNGLALATAATEAAEHTMKLLRQAQDELTVEKVFGQEFWDWTVVSAEGNPWKFTLKVDANEEPSWIEVLNAHPLISKWTMSTKETMRRWSINIEEAQEISSANIIK
ncbi:MAG: Essential protein Yae1, N terminal [Vezdaea aestivalis]|nr:MAG: Essential protein Yae1, N terminal [Vezdaea aestivalis]